jgi:DNA-binding XRE family transcriptional regulator
MAKNKQECLRMIANEVKSVRTRYQPKLTQDKLAVKMKVHKQSISNIENAQYLSSIDTLLDVAIATKTNLIIRFYTDEELKAEKELNDLVSKKKINGEGQ